MKEDEKIIGKTRERKTNKREEREKQGDRMMKKVKTKGQWYVKDVAQVKRRMRKEKGLERERGKEGKVREREDNRGQDKRQRERGRER